MKPSHSLSLVMLLATSCCTVASATESGWYAGVLSGVTGHRDQSFRLEGDEPESGRSGFSSSLLAGGTIGYRFASGWRVEGEFVYQRVDRDGMAFQATELQGEGDYASTGFALNTLYEVNLFGSTRARSYLGVGLVSLTEVDIDFETAAGERSFSGKDTAFQLLAGVRYDIGRNWYLDAGLRQLRASTLRLDGESSTPGVIRGDYRPWAATLAAGWRF